MVKVLAPATSANCCVGFDSLGLALDWRAAYSFELADSFLITGCPAEYAGKDNLVFQAFIKAAAYKNREVPFVHIVIDSDLPFARGLGSSSACIAGGILGADALLDLQLTRDEMLEIATEMEGHPDNAAPALFGGMTACFMNGSEVIYTEMPAGSWKALAVVPETPVSTEEARKILPQTLPYKEAVSQTGHALVFERAFVLEQEELLTACCQDVLHEPYRCRLIPEYPAMKQLAQTYQAPFWISGSGSTMLFLSLSEDKLANIQQEIARSHPGLYTRITQVSSRGAYIQKME